VSGSTAGAIGLLAAAAVAALTARASLRRAGAIVGIAVVVFGGVIVFRAAT
jgi:hypothetical protein